MGKTENSDKPTAPSRAQRTPAGSAGARKERRITYRVSEADYLKIEAAASNAGVSVASYSRARALERPTTRHPVPVDIASRRDTLRAFTKVAVNINQIARHLNMNGIPMPDELATAGQRIDASRAEVMATMRRA
jgi:hypothetical protein